MVYFCPYCANMLLIEYGREGATRFYCQTCAYVCPIPRKLTKTFHLKRKAVDDVLGDDAWVHADTEQITCPKCANDTAYFTQMQSRSADEPMTTYYKCTKCGHRWNWNG